MTIYDISADSCHDIQHKGQAALWVTNGCTSGSESSLFFSNNFFSLGFKPIQDDFQHDFARMTDEADSSVVLAKLQVALFRECNNQRLIPWGRPFSCSPDPVTDLC